MNNIENIIHLSNRVCCLLRIEGFDSKICGRLRFFPVATAAAAAMPTGPKKGEKKVVFWHSITFRIYIVSVSVFHGNWTMSLTTALSWAIKRLTIYGLSAPSSGLSDNHTSEYSNVQKPTCSSQMCGDLICSSWVKYIRVVVSVIIRRRWRILVSAQHAMLCVRGHVYLPDLLTDMLGLNSGHVLRMMHHVVFHHPIRFLSNTLRHTNNTIAQITQTTQVHRWGEYNAPVIGGGRAHFHMHLKNMKEHLW